LFANGSLLPSVGGGGTKQLVTLPTLHGDNAGGCGDTTGGTPPPPPTGDLLIFIHLNGIVALFSFSSP